MSAIDSSYYIIMGNIVSLIGLYATRPNIIYTNVIITNQTQIKNPIRLNETQISQFRIISSMRKHQYYVPPHIFEKYHICAKCQQFENVIASWISSMQTHIICQLCEYNNPSTTVSNNHTT